jgi:SOS-response transcriptional repressor LexA
MSLLDQSPLTPRQAQALDLVRRFAFLYGRPASIRELADLMKIRSPNGVVFHLKSLIRRRLIRRVDVTRGDTRRSLYLPAEPTLVVEPTLVGVRVGTTGPAVELTPTEWRAWLARQIELFGAA